MTKDPFLPSPFLPSTEASDDATAAVHCAGEAGWESEKALDDRTTNGMEVADEAELKQLLYAARFMEASRKLPQNKGSGDAPVAEHLMERVRLITGRCSSLLTMAGRGASGYLGGGTAPCGAEWNYAIAGSNLRARMVQECRVDLIRAVAGMAEVDVTGDAPLQQASRLKKMTPSVLMGRSNSGGDVQPDVQRADSCSSVISARRLTGYRHDIVEVRELSCEGSTPADTAWQVITCDPNIHTKADDVFSSTIIDLLEEPARSMCVILHPPPASMALPQPRPKHSRCPFLQVLVLLEPLGELPDGNLRANGTAVPVRITRIFEVEVPYAVRKILQFMPTMVMRKLANKMAAEEEEGINSYFEHSALLSRAIEAGPRAELYAQLRARWAKFSGPGS
jgi:hypothetical protein